MGIYMKRFVVIIHQCGGCPNFDFDEYRCLSTGNGIKPEDECPEWCPLPDYSEPLLTGQVSGQESSDIKEDGTK